MNSTALIADDLDTFGATIAAGDIDNRPMPDDEAIKAAVACAFEPIIGLFEGTPLAADLTSTLWGIVNAFHAQPARVERQIDENEQTQRRLRDQHDGSEINDTKLTRAVDVGSAMVQRRNVLAEVYDAAAEEFEMATGNVWSTRAGTRRRTKRITGAMIDSRDAERAKRQGWTEDHLPAGPYIIVSGGKEFDDVDLIWRILDREREKRGRFTLLHGGAPGVQTIAAKWADKRGIDQVRFQLDRKRFADRAGFARNEKMLDYAPVRVITFPGSGITKALLREARVQNIDTWDYEEAYARRQKQREAKAEDERREQDPSASCAPVEQIAETHPSEQPTEDNKPDVPTETPDPITGVTLATLHNLMNEYGLERIAERFGITLDTVRRWLNKGIPESKYPQLVEMVAT